MWANNQCKSAAVQPATSIETGITTFENFESPFKGKTHFTNLYTHLKCADVFYFQTISIVR